jgi:hypothetical protein
MCIFIYAGDSGKRIITSAVQQAGKAPLLTLVRCTAQDLFLPIAFLFHFLVDTVALR